MRYVFIAMFAALLYGDDITIPLEGGNIVIQPEFIRVNEVGIFVPELSFRLKNGTPYPWNTIKLKFDIGGLCKGEPRQWTVPAVTSLGWAEGHQLVKEYTDTVISLIGEVDGCKAEIIKASLVFAENPKLHIDGITGERVDLQKQLQELKEKREAEAAAQAEEDRKSAEAQAEAQRKEDAAEAARRKRLAAEQRRKQAEEDAKAAEDRRRIRAACGVIYQRTADKKVSDLTVKEEQQVRACQGLGLYPPQ